MLWRDYIEDRSADLVDVRRLEDAWKALGPFFGRRAGYSLTKEDCRDYVAMRKNKGLAGSTIRTELDYLQACLNFRYGTGSTRIWRPPPSKPRGRYLTREELRQLLAHVASFHVELFIVLAVTTGARMKSILSLRWESVNFDHRIISFEAAGRQQTNKRETEVPINGRALAVLRAAVLRAQSDHVIEWRGSPVRSVKKAIREAAKRSGISCSPHVFRHTAGVWLAEADVPMQKIAQYLGHTSMRVTERTYARYSPSYLRDAAAALEW